MLIDTHVHLNAHQYDEDLNEVIQRAQANDVEKMLVVGFDKATIERAVKLAEQYDFIHIAVGWHPVDAIDLTDELLQWIESIAVTNKKVVAIGEIGLDYHWDKSPKDIQAKVFRQQIQLAKRLKLPIIIHNREAMADCLTILKEEGANEVGGVMHSFSGSVESMQQALALNFHISLGGPVTFKNAKQPKAVAQAVPLNKLLIETDAPYLTPHPYRGQRNEPAHVKLVAEEIAQLRNSTYQEIANITTKNAEKLFNI